MPKNKVKMKGEAGTATGGSGAQWGHPREEPETATGYGVWRARSLGLGFKGCVIVSSSGHVSFFPFWFIKPHPDKLTATWPPNYRGGRFLLSVLLLYGSPAYRSHRFLVPAALACFRNTSLPCKETRSLRKTHKGILKEVTTTNRTFKSFSILVRVYPGSRHP